MALSSFLTGKPRSATVETVGDAVILEVTEDKLSELVARRPRVMQVLQEYSDMRAKGTNERIQFTQKTLAVPEETITPPKAPKRRKRPN